MYHSGSGQQQQQQQQSSGKSMNLAGTSQQQLFAQLAHQYSAMHLQWLSNSSVTCNDGTRAGYYIRPSPTGSRRWIIFLEGGWYCMSKSACDQRWYKMRDFMTSFRWSQYKTVSGILSSSPSMNPYWWNANHVFIPYCSSDIWSGDSPAKPPTMAMSFFGSRIIDEVIGELIRSPTYGFLDSKFILLAGSSAGAAGVMINLDRVAKMISDAGSSADVRGLADSGWIMDSDDHHHHHHQMPVGFTNQDKQQSSSSSSMPCADGICSPTEMIRGAYRLWNSRVPESCAKQYPQEPWRCYFGYRLYPTLSTPLFVVQFQYDEFQLYMDGLANQAMNEMERIHYIRQLSQQMIQTLTNVSAVFVPSCMAHILLTKLDWYKVSINGRKTANIFEMVIRFKNINIINNNDGCYAHHHHYIIIYNINHNACIR
ncbi:notum-like protein [Dermatophagoides farinae]|uniref:Notum-like protein n=1 Tax=Dermatophagoides farinae TaxID=6954 RepID=A0A9D4NX72_DERFA|nr:notum-like protein [Dermatophagoides farinae]